MITVASILRRSVLAVAGVAIFTLATAWVVSKEKPKKKQLPNIVIIMADDLGYGDFSCQGATKVSTPAIDALAESGMRFTDAHTASSLCSPSRYSILTGRYSWRTRLRTGVLTWFAQPLIEQGRTTIASMLKRNGYRTACIGKWHLGFEWALKPNAPADPVKDVFDSWERTTQDYIDFSKPVKQGPVERGFDYYYGISASNNMIPFVYIENDHVVEPPTVQKEYVYDTDQPCLRAPNWNLETIDQELTKKAVSVIDDHFKQYRDKPLFLYFPTSAIHRPALPTFTKGKSRAGLRGDKIEEFDWVVDQIVKTLKKNNAFDNTLLIVTSDNGGVPGDAFDAIQKYHKDLGDKYYLDYFSDYKPEYIKPGKNGKDTGGWLTYGHKASGEFRGFKADAWEGGHRVPLIMHWPGEIKAGAVNNNTVCNTDLLATFAELVGDKLAPNEGEDSYSYLGNILGTSSKQVRRSMTIVSGGGGAYVVNHGDWTYIESGKAAWGQTFYKGGPFPKDFQLYNIKTDPGEKHNLYNKMPDKVAEFKAIIERVEHKGKTEDKEG
ncbi:arylsulfatase (plasmid) [Pedobacter sp. BS3]|uniref:sulfatase family protein n=1 Tax=Pedobacter sp. BS3 TaxID=2567937 RepID=UPI0011EBFF5A|nr:arylsulfatase [Pedobacter sp. BS3]TZF85508.1 arylsulfatase [Pedobacter sp. BS3]